MAGHLNFVPPTAMPAVAIGLPSVLPMQGISWDRSGPYYRQDFGFGTGEWLYPARRGGMFGRVGADLSSPRAVMPLPPASAYAAQEGRGIGPGVSPVPRLQGPWAQPASGTYGKGVAVFTDEPTPFQRLQPEIEKAYVELARNPKSTADDLLAFGQRNSFEVGRDNAERFIRDRSKPGARVADRPGYIPTLRPPVDPGDGATGAFLRGFANPVNMLDEMGGVADTLGGTPGRENVWNSDRRFGDILWQNIDQNRSILGFDEAKHPLASYGGQIASGFVGPVLSVEGVGLAAARAALHQGAKRAVARQAARRAVASRLAVSGGATGALAGLGAGEGDIVDRLPSTAFGGTFGAIAAPATGLAAPFVARGAIPLRNHGSGRIPLVWDAARRVFGRRASVDGQQERIAAQGAEASAFVEPPALPVEPPFDVIERPITDLGVRAQFPERIRSAEQQRLSDALQGPDFDSIDFGLLSKAKFDQINAIRTQLGQDVLQERNLVIPEFIVRHLYEGRVLRDGMEPDQVADVLYSALHANKAKIVRTRHAQIQAVVNPREKISNVGFVAKHTGTGQTILKSGYPIYTRDIRRKIR